MLRSGAENFVKSWKFDVSNSAPQPDTKYQTIIQYIAIQKTIDPRDDNNPMIHSDSFHHFEITDFVSNIYLSNCPTGAGEDVPSEIAKDDYVEVSRNDYYSIKVQADGKVIWDGKWSVQVKGRREARIDANAARNLVENFAPKNSGPVVGITQMVAWMEAQDRLR
jgi:hypothetical protein